MKSQGQPGIARGFSITLIKVKEKSWKTNLVCKVVTLFVVSGFISLHFEIPILEATLKSVLNSVYTRIL